LISFSAHFPYAAEPGPEPTAVVREVAAPGQVVTLGLSVRSTGAPAHVEVASPELVGPVGRIPASALDLHLVKAWEQAGLGVYQSDRCRVPELLLKEDVGTLQGAWTRRRFSWRHLVRTPPLVYAPPRLRLTGPLRLELATDTAHQVVVTVRVPAEAAPGTYSGELLVQGTALALEVEVLDLRLAQPRQDLVLWYRGSLDWRNARDYVPRETFAAHLREIRAHGFTGISLTETRPGLLREAARLVEDAGLHGTVVLAGDPAHLPPGAFRKASPVHYVSDEIDARGPASTPAHLWTWRRARARGGRTMASLVSGERASVFRRAGLDYSPDLLLLYLPRNVERFLAGGSDAYYYWQTHMEKPTLHRLLLGVFLWKSGARGAAPYCFQHMPEPPGSPFDDFGPWEQGEPPSKQHMTTYPAEGGSVPTLQWLGLREGIDDLRYLVTLDAALEAADRAHAPRLAALAAAARRRRDTFVERLLLARIDIVSATEREPLPGIAPHEYRDFRVQLGRDAAAIQAALGPR
jgi:hypothetical protein